MNSALDTILKASVSALADQPIQSGRLERFGKNGRALAELLCQKNGFYAYESALLVRPESSLASPLGIFEWNEPWRWKHLYHSNLSAILFFAEDAFGCQFGIRDDSIVGFDPETGEISRICNTLPQWAECIMANTNEMLGVTLAHDWQITRERLKPGRRLCPKVPFVLGGGYSVDNLAQVVETDGMLFRGFISRKIANLPDGATVVLRMKSTATGYELE